MITRPTIILFLIGDNMDKKTLREIFLNMRETMDPILHKQLNTMLLMALKEVLSEYPLKKIGIFYPMEKEIDLRPLEKDYGVYYPKVEPEGIVFYENNGQFEKSAFGVMEPVNSVPVDKQALDAIIVPGLVYDDGLYRLGYGKGYYDHLLKDYQGLKIGVVFEKFRMEALPSKAHDIPVDILVTDNQIYESRHDSDV